MGQEFRLFSTKISESESKWHPVRVGLFKYRFSALSPLCFILYTNMCQSSYGNRYILKFSDDTVNVSLLQNTESGHGPVVNDFITWCNESFLVLNTLKTLKTH